VLLKSSISFAANEKNPSNETFTPIYTENYSISDGEKKIKGIEVFLSNKCKKIIAKFIRIGSGKFVSYNGF